MPNGGWDFQVERIALDGLGIDASKRLGMVIVQPQFELAPDAAVPFRISTPYTQSLIESIERAFAIRAAESQERGISLPFVLFPEAAIPVTTADGLGYLRRQMEEAAGEVVFIGGLEGLSPSEALEVANAFNAPKPVFRAGAFANLCVIAIKSANGNISWHFQAKLRPSQWEQPRNMARGHGVHRRGQNAVMDRDVRFSLFRTGESRS